MLPKNAPIKPKWNFNENWTAPNDSQLYQIESNRITKKILCEPHSVCTHPQRISTAYYRLKIRARARFEGFAECSTWAHSSNTTTFAVRRFARCWYFLLVFSVFCFSRKIKIIYIFFRFCCVYLFFKKKKKLASPAHTSLSTFTIEYCILSYHPFYSHTTISSKRTLHLRNFNTFFLCLKLFRIVGKHNTNNNNNHRSSHRFFLVKSNFGVYQLHCTQHRCITSHQTYSHTHVHKRIAHILQIKLDTTNSIPK